MLTPLAVLPNKAELDLLIRHYEIEKSRWLGDLGSEHLVIEAERRKGYWQIIKELLIFDQKI